MGGITLRLPFLINIFHTKHDKKITHFFRHYSGIFLVKWTDEEYVVTNCRSNVTRTVYQAQKLCNLWVFFLCLSVRNVVCTLTGTCMHRRAAFSKASARERSPTKQYLWRHFLLFSRRTFAGARFAERSTELYVRYAYMNPDVEFFKKCLKMCSMKFWSCLGSILQKQQKTELFTRRSDTTWDFKGRGRPRFLPPGKIGGV